MSRRRMPVTDGRTEATDDGRDIPMGHFLASHSLFSPSSYFPFEERSGDILDIGVSLDARPRKVIEGYRGLDNCTFGSIYNPSRLLRSPRWNIHETASKSRSRAWPEITSKTSFLARDGTSIFRQCLPQRFRNSGRHLGAKRPFPVK